MKDYSDFYEAREKIVNIVKEDLLGPVFEEEIINEPPTSYYIMGKLYPNTKNDVISIDNGTSAELDSLDADCSLASANTKNPRAMGITYTVVSDCISLRLCVSYATYKPYSYEEAQKNDLNLARYNEIINSTEKNEKMLFWKRNPMVKEIMISVDNNSVVEIEPGIFVKTFIHLTTNDGEKVITTVVTNERVIDEENQTEIAEASVFQTRLHIEAPDGRQIFTEVSRQVAMTDNEELLQLEMLYANDICYAQGHGCAVMWDKESTSPRYIESEFIPSFELKQMKAFEIKDNPVFNMHYLYTADHNEIIKYLKDFVGLYQQWIKDKYLLLDSSEYLQYKEMGNMNLGKCTDICNRIVHSIDLLDDENGNAWKAFKMANEAMFMQRCQSIKKQNDFEKIDESKINWYPFQLAFVLLEITSFVEYDGYDRKLVDLLWFPTGGGKTEAYLGISAFAIFYRRLSNPSNCNGLNIIMRYTLRLLTIQQFERASILICACELLRKKYKLPGDEISIGLWVGNTFTPGTVEEADRVLTKIMSNVQINGDDVDPCQVKICPWCGKKLQPINYHVKNSVKRMEICCQNDKCDYYNVPLPVRLIDEEIYEYKPTFLVATVDKFAQIAIQDKIAALFSMENDNLPPELIIQDELHLISGPLGTMTGLYEAAITHICEKKGRKVKIIASTATIRNASKQIMALYGREYNQFPPQGICSNDSFFAVESSLQEKPARFYAGLMGVGTTFTTTVIRLYAAWLFASRYLVDLGYSEEVVDNFWTLTGYFNSIRELGATKTQVFDDIQSRYRYLKQNKFKDKYMGYSGKDSYENVVELTSRMSNDEISKVIQEDLKRGYTRTSQSDVYDFVLASNMISVGVDVGRLGTMAVAGQSKTNAEYIQATSRVGRNNPGLVFTVYNANRSRDRSHYEQFSRYHSALYRYVEATSLTPFSDRARDRGLQALFIILCRYYCKELLPNEAASKFNRDIPEVKIVEQLIYKYVDTVDEREKDKVLFEIKDIEKKWEEQAQACNLWYRKKGKPSLLQPDTDEDSRFRIMNSMRSVENESGIYLVGEYE